MDKQTFISQIAAYVIKYAAQYGIKVHSPIIAQAILESGWGQSSLAAKYHNYFGLKCGSAWTGKSVNMATSEEYTPGVHTNIRDNFRVFDSMEDGVKGYFDFINYSRYANLKGVTDPQTYVENIKADGYATSSTYVTNLMRVIRDNNLTQYDGAAQQTPSKSVDEVAQDVVNASMAMVLIVKQHLKQPGTTMMRFRQRSMRFQGQTLHQKKSVDEIAQEVINGAWGNGQDRKNRIEQAGYDYTAVQNKVNELCGTPKKSIDEIARAVIRGEYGNGADRKNRITAEGYDYAAVQARVNDLM